MIALDLGALLSGREPLTPEQEAYGWAIAERLGLIDGIGAGGEWERHVREGVVSRDAAELITRAKQAAARVDGGDADTSDDDRHARWVASLSELERARAVRAGWCVCPRMHLGPCDDKDS